MMSFRESQHKTESSKVYSTAGEFILNIFKQQFHSVVEQPVIKVSMDLSKSHMF